MKPCAPCHEAESNPTRGGMFYVECLGCQARMIAGSLAASQALAGDVDAGDQMRAMIEKVWQGDYATGRAAVWAWMKRVKEYGRRSDDT